MTKIHNFAFDISENLFVGGESANDNLGIDVTFMMYSPAVSSGWSWYKEFQGKAEGTLVSIAFYGVANVAALYQSTLLFIFSAAGVTLLQ